jgi:nitroimidazol reductase NimA-like FMN-containing flavoprotein (pyridoxamine 5'-phosphate oxidase superfamily)
MLDSFGLEMLDRQRCLALLATASVGRLVFTTHGLPAVRAMKFALRADAIWFVAPADSPVFAACRDSVVAFEADAFHQDLASGWCVTLIGRAQEVHDPGSLVELTGLTWQSWSPTVDYRCIRIPAEAISGRQLDRDNGK